MSSVASRRVTKPPEKGVFPLDHFGECKEVSVRPMMPCSDSDATPISAYNFQIADKYLACLENEDGEAAKCKGLVKLYLECRMEKQLMAKQDIGSFGIDPVVDLEGK